MDKTNVILSIPLRMTSLSCNHLNFDEFFFPFVSLVKDYVWNLKISRICDVIYIKIIKESDTFFSQCLGDKIDFLKPVADTARAVYFCCL